MQGERRHAWGGRILTPGALVGMLLAVGAFGHSTPATSAQQDDQASLRELAEQLLAQPYASYPGAPTQEQRVELLVGQQPSGLPLALPVPPNGRLLGSLVRRADVQMTSAEVVVEAPGASDQALDFYEQALSALGWRTQSPPVTTGGFQGPPPTRSSIFRPPSGNETVSLMLFPPGTEHTTVRATVSFPAPAAVGVPQPYSPCSATPVPMPTPVASPLPELTPPPGIQLVSLPLPPPLPPGAPGTQSAADATTSLSPAELEAHFARQLQGAGWRRQAGRAEGPLAWSTWQLPDEGDSQGFLMVLATPGQDKRYLHLRGDSAASGGTAGVPGMPRAVFTLPSGPTVAPPTPALPLSEPVVTGTASPAQPIPIPTPSPTATAPQP